MTLPLRVFASTLRATARAFEEGEEAILLSLLDLRERSRHLEIAFEGMQRERGTLEHASQDMHRLRYLWSALVKAMEELARSAFEEDMAEG